MADLPQTFVSGFHDEEKVRKMKYNAFGDTGLNVSEISLGTGGFCLAYGNYSLESCKDTVHTAVKSGINYIDTAPYYGNGVSEEVLGKCLQGVPRQAYYLATKVGRYDPDPKLMFNFSAEKTRQSLKTSLARLGVDYIDVIQVHDIEFASSVDVVINETLPVLVEFVKAGKARFIGVTGYAISVLKDCIAKSPYRINTVLSYSRLTLFDQSLQEFLPFFQSKNLAIINACAHGLGLLTNFGPQPWLPAQQEIKDVCKEAREYCKKQGVELGKLALYYSLQQPGPHTNLVGINRLDILDLNLDVVYNGLTSNELEVMSYLQKNIFPKIQKPHWEGIEIAALRKTLQGS